MKIFIVLAAVVVLVSSQGYRPEVPQYAPIPYSFNYQADTEDGGSSGHQEYGDGGGRVQGSYTVTDLEGHTRVVEYVADENGFRATVRTNEPGTANVNPADVVMESSAAVSPVISYGLGDNSVRTAVQPTYNAGQPLYVNRNAGQPLYANRRQPQQGQGVRYVLVPADRVRQ